MPGGVGPGGGVVGPGGGSGLLLSYKVVDLVADVLREIRVLNAVDGPTPEDQTLVVRKLNRILDRWNAQREAVYASTLSRFQLTPGLSPHTIGPAGTWSVVQRPVSIESAAWIDTTGISRPITIRPSDWWDQQPLKTLTLAFPTDLYYEPDWPNGQLFFWPVPTTALFLDLRQRLVLAQLAIGDTVSMPPGYVDALIYTAAEECVGPMGVDLPPLLSMQSRAARAIAFANNSEAEPFVSDAPGTGGGAYFDYRTGGYR